MGSVDEAGKVWDDMSGQELGPGMVAKAGDEYLQALKKHGVYGEVPSHARRHNTGRAPTDGRWVVTRKGGRDRPRYRRRRLAKGIHTSTGVTFERPSHPGRH